MKTLSLNSIKERLEKSYTDVKDVKKLDVDPSEFQGRTHTVFNLDGFGFSVCSLVKGEETEESSYFRALFCHQTNELFTF